MLLYFQEENGRFFKGIFKYNPYFYILARPGVIKEANIFIQKKFEQYIHQIEIIERTDLDQANHLSGLQIQVLKVSFKNIQNLL